tara:strand:+ start:175 stop:774 length:600 start_codon:yes stop_codon:yes gene_type:complete
MIDAILIGGAYLLGSISTAILVSRLAGIGDPRDLGSGNPGATNILRLAGKLPATATIFGDILKGALPVLLARIIAENDATIPACLVAAFLGHLFPLFFQFRGGKGVATALGGLTAISWQLGLSVAIVWLTVALISRYSSLASILSALAAPLISYAFGQTAVYIVATALVSSLLIRRHKTNIERLLTKSEPKIGAKDGRQ